MMLVKKTKNSIAALYIFLTVLFLYVIFYKNIAILINGMSYIANDVDNYTYSLTNVDADCVFTVDLDNLDSNTGKVIYHNNDGCRIIIHIVQKQDVNVGGYRIIFRSIGTYSINGAKLISGIYHEIWRDENSGNPYGTYHMEATMKCIYNGKIYDSNVQGLSGISYKNGDSFGFYLFPSEAYKNGDVPLDNAGTAEIIISNLAINEWRRIKG